MVSITTRNGCNDQLRNGSRAAGRLGRCLSGVGRGCTFLGCAYAVESRLIGPLEVLTNMLHSFHFSFQGSVFPDEPEIIPERHLHVVNLIEPMKRIEKWSDRFRSRNLIRIAWVLIVRMKYSR